MPTREEIKTFSLMIEAMAGEMKCDYLDAILHHCGQTGLEVEVASTLISPALKSKIREQAETNNQLKKTSRLPL
ncbi:MAG: hypothetical protein EBU90_21285 [Proteobacteria bacterium]|nr:hypothetical protein [Pseudomonadota bacterium]